MVKSSKSERTYTLAEIDIRLRSDGFSQEQVKEVVTTLERTEIPEGGIRFKDACDEFNIPPSCLSEAVKRGTVLELRRRGRKFLVLDRKSVVVYAELRARFPGPGRRPRNDHKK